jgi:hypothetical protein
MAKKSAMGPAHAHMSPAVSRPVISELVKAVRISPSVNTGRWTIVWAIPVVETTVANSMKMPATAMSPKSPGESTRAMKPAMKSRAKALSKVLEARNVAPRTVLDLSDFGFAPVSLDL